MCVHVGASGHGSPHILDRGRIADACGVVVDKILLKLLHLLISEYHL